MSDQVTQRRWLPAFSIRTLLIAMTLLCGYAACWWPTKTQGEKDVAERFPAYLWASRPPSAIAPLVVSHDVMNLWDRNGQRIDWPTDKDDWADWTNGVADVGPTRVYCFWFFGYVAKLPYEHATDVPEADVQIRIDAANSDIEKAKFGLP